MEYEEWCEEHHDRIMQELEENGATGEMDFDPEAEFEVRYDVYFNS